MKTYLKLIFILFNCLFILELKWKEKRKSVNECSYEQALRPIARSLSTLSFLSLNKLKEKEAIK